MRHRPVGRSAEVMGPWWPRRATARAIHQAIGPERRARSVAQSAAGPADGAVVGLRGEFPAEQVGP